VRADVVQLSQLFQNLIGNALKYRGKEPPQVTVAAHRRGDKWLFSVSDNGVGVPPHQRERIFAPLKRLHGREIPGTGIGLAICTRIVERAGGQIWVESKVGQGSTFYFTLPVDWDGVLAQYEKHAHGNLASKIIDVNACIRRSRTLPSSHTPSGNNPFRVNESVTEKNPAKLLSYRVSRYRSMRPVNCEGFTDLATDERNRSD
jgi:hypothetical protein